MSSVFTMRKQLLRAFKQREAAGKCPGKPTTTIVRRLGRLESYQRRETRTDGPPCLLCGQQHVTTIVVIKRDREFFRRGVS